MADFVVMPKTDYQDACDAVREKTGKSDLIKSGEMSTEIRNIPVGGGDTEVIEQMIDESGVLDSTEGTVEEKVEQVIDYANFKNIIQEALYHDEGSGAYNQMSIFANTSVEDVSMFDFSKVKYFGNGFTGTKIKNLNIDVTNCNGALSYLCSGCTDLKSVVIKMNSNIKQLASAFNGCINLESIETLNLSSVTDVSYGVNNAFNNNIALKEIRFVENCIKVSISFGYSPLLSAESIQSIIDGLAPVTTANKLTLHSSVIDKLTEEQYIMVFSKNWEIV